MLPTTLAPPTSKTTWWRHLRGDAAGENALPPPPTTTIMQPPANCMHASGRMLPATAAARTGHAAHGKPQHGRGRPCTYGTPLQPKQLNPCLGPPPPAGPPVISLFLQKPRGTSLGLKFYGDPDDAERKLPGALVVAVDPHGLAWRKGLKVGDRILFVRVFSALRPLEVLAESEVHDGYSAAKALRPAVGRVEVRVARPVPTRRETAATLIAAAWRGFVCRCTPYRWDAAATRLQCAWRACVARWDARDLRLKQQVISAALRIQTAWRRYDAWVRRLGRSLALEHLQKETRAWLLRRRCARGQRGLGRPSAPGMASAPPPLPPKPQLQRNASPGGTPSVALEIASAGAEDLDEEEDDEDDVRGSGTAGTRSPTPSRARKRMRSTIRAPPRLDW